MGDCWGIFYFSSNIHLKVHLDEMKQVLLSVVRKGDKWYQSAVVPPALKGQRQAVPGPGLQYKGLH